MQGILQKGAKKTKIDSWKLNPLLTFASFCKKLNQMPRIKEVTSDRPMTGAAPRDVQKRRLFGLVTRKERWGLSGKLKR